MIKRFYLDLRRTHSILVHRIVSIVDNEDLHSALVTNGNEVMIVNSIEMAIEEENVLHDLNSERARQLTVNNSNIHREKNPSNQLHCFSLFTLIRPNSNCRTSFTVGSTNTAGYSLVLGSTYKRTNRFSPFFTSSSTSSFCADSFPFT